MMTTKYDRVLYHVTPNHNIGSIYESGLNPLYSTGMIKAVWMVTKRNILWAIAHCSARHSVSADDLVVFTVPADGYTIVRFPTTGLYYCKQVIQVENHAVATLFIPQEIEVI